MNDAATVAITGVGLWLPGFPNTAAWLAGTADAAAAKPVGTALDRVNRRRASSLDRALADTVAAAIAMAGADATTVPIVIGSSIGEGIGLAITHAGPVVVACGDEPAPATLVQHAPPWSMVTAAVVLAPFDAARPHLARLTLGTDAPATLALDRFEPLQRENPQIGLLAVVDAVLRGTAGVLPLDNGKGRGYRAAIAPAPR